MKQSNIVRTLLVFMTIAAPSTAVMYSARADPTSSARDIYAVKPLNDNSPGFSQLDLRQRPEGFRGFPGFVQEMRGAVQTPEGVPRTAEGQDTSFEEISAESQLVDPTYASSIPIKLGKNPHAEITAEIFLGFSVRQILYQVPSTGTSSGERPPNTAGRNRGTAGRLGIASGGGGSLGSGANWLSGGFLPTGGSFKMSGFGLDLEPLAYPKHLENGPYHGLSADDPGVAKSLKALRSMVLDLVFNPFVYFSAMIAAVLMFMSRFRGS